MASWKRIIDCLCCGKRGHHQARGLTATCYTNHQRAGTLHKFPRLTQPAEPWQPLGSHGRRMLERYAQLADVRPALSTQRIAFELGVSERQVWRYAAALRVQAQGAA